MLKKIEQPTKQKNMGTVAVNIRLPEEIRERLQKLAESEHRSLSNLISKILLDYLKEREKPPT
jgi:predicted transcriptional regulator